MDLGGGKFAHGFWSAGIQEALTPYIQTLTSFGDNYKIQGYNVFEATLAGLVSGTISDRSGGSFANGFVSGFYQNIFNNQGERAKSHRGQVAEEQSTVVETREEREWEVKVAAGDYVADRLQGSPHLGAKVLSKAVDELDVLNMQTRTVTTSQVRETKTIVYDTWFEGPTDDPKSWVEVPYVRHNPRTIQIKQEVIWENTKLEYRFCLVLDKRCL